MSVTCFLLFWIAVSYGHCKKECVHFNTSDTLLVEANAHVSLNISIKQLCSNLSLHSIMMSYTNLWMPSAKPFFYCQTLISQESINLSNCTFDDKEGLLRVSKLVSHSDDEVWTITAISHGKPVAQKVIRIIINSASTTEDRISESNITFNVTMSPLFPDNVTAAAVDSQERDSSLLIEQSTKTQAAEVYSLRIDSATFWAILIFPGLFCGVTFLSTVIVCCLYCVVVRKLRRFQEKSNHQRSTCEMTRPSDSGEIDPPMYPVLSLRNHLYDAVSLREGNDRSSRVTASPKHHYLDIADVNGERSSTVLP